MWNTVGNYYDPVVTITARNFAHRSEKSGQRFLDHMMEHKDNIDKQDVVDHLGQFSCREEMERYVEHREHK